MKLKKLLKMMSGCQSLIIKSTDGTWLTGWISPGRAGEMPWVCDLRIENVEIRPIKNLCIAVRPPKITKSQKKVLKDKIAGMSDDEKRKLMGYLLGEESGDYDTGDFKAGASGGGDGDQTTGRPREDEKRSLGHRHVPKAHREKPVL